MTAAPKTPLPRLEELFAREPDRLSRLSAELAGLYFDWSKTHLDQALVAHFSERAERMGFAKARQALFAGEAVNTSEGRPATHVAERGSGAPQDVDLAAARHQRTRALVDAVEAGAFGDVTGVLHIGIGGSVLGPALLVDALGRGDSRLNVRFLSNIDGQAFDDAVSTLDPATTLIVAVSKTFTTAETLANMNAALDWLGAADVADPYGRVIAVTASPDAAVAAGIDETRILQFAEGVGGRYSLWSSVGISAALAFGWNGFEELLEGAAEMDRHFRFAEPAENIPLLAAFADRFYVETLGCQTRAVFAYDERLRLLPFYLQQLEMELNGKSVTTTGEPVSGATAPVTWGGVGTDAQHAVFQLLHQGTVRIPVEFVAVAESEDSLDPEHHRQLLLNAFAQGSALMTGRTSADPERSYAGNRPSTTILLERLDPRTLGALIAFYEHRTFANAVLMGINPFDQFGVELGKQIARKLSDAADHADMDASTRALIEKGRDLMADFDLFVIGAGSGGVRAARVSAAYGARVAIAEEHKVGGTCVIRGCVPKKLLVYGAHFAEDLDDAAMFGWDIPQKQFDWVVLRDNVLSEVDRLEGAYTETLSNHKVTIFPERAQITGPNSVRLAGGRDVTADKILIATGAWPVMPEIEGIEHAISSNEVFHLERMPKRIVIAGGGYIANEFAGIFHEFGAHVTLVNRTDVMLRHYDQQIVDRLIQISLRKGIDFRFNASIDRIERAESGALHVSMTGCDDLEADEVLFALGRRPNIEGLGLEAAGVELGDKGKVKVDEDNRTSVPSIFAVGDVTDRVQLTPVAIREGNAFADSFFGNKPTRVDYGCIPSAVFSHPPLASVGMTEGEARHKIGPVKIYTSDFRPMKNVLAGRNERSLYKLVVDGETDEIVGLHMIGPDAPEILQAAAIAVKAKLKKADFDATIALHPTMSEELVLMR